MGVGERSQSAGLTGEGDGAAQELCERVVSACMCMPG